MLLKEVSPVSFQFLTCFFYSCGYFTYKHTNPKRSSVPRSSFSLFQFIYSTKSIMITHKIAICEMGLPRSYPELISGSPIINIHYRAQITNSSSSNCNLKLTLMSQIPTAFHNSTTFNVLNTYTYLFTYLSIYNISKHSSCLQTYSVDTRALTEVAVPGGGGCRRYKNGLGFLNKAKLGNRGSVCHINVSPALSLLCF